MVWVSAECPNLLSRRGHTDLRFLLGIFGDLQIVQRNCPMFVQEFCSFQLLERERLIRPRLLVSLKSVSNVVAQNLKQQLSFRYVVAKLRVNCNDPPRGKRNHWDRFLDVRSYCSR